MDAKQLGIDAYLLLIYDTPIHAIAKHTVRFSSQEMFEFAEGFWYADRILHSK